MSALWISERTGGGGERPATALPGRDARVGSGSGATPHFRLDQCPLGLPVSGGARPLAPALSLGDLLVNESRRYFRQD